MSSASSRSTWSGLLQWKSCGFDFHFQNVPHRPYFDTVWFQRCLLNACISTKKRHFWISVVLKWVRWGCDFFVRIGRELYKIMWKTGKVFLGQRSQTLTGARWISADSRCINVIAHLSLKMRPFAGTRMVVLTRSSPFYVCFFSWMIDAIL